MALVTDTPQQQDAGRKTRGTAARNRARNGGPRIGSHIFLLMLVIYFITPLWWLTVASTKDTAGLFGGSGGPLWFDDGFHFFSNLQGLFERQDGIYWRWLGNSFLYAISGGVGATVLAVLAGYGFAKYNFRGRAAFFGILLGAVMVPLTALVIPTFVLLSSVDLVNTIWAVILPSLLSPFGVYLMRVFAQEAVPDELLDAARIDGAGEIRTFFQIALPLLRPAIVTVLLLSVVGTWNNFFLPLAVLSDPLLLPVTVGLNGWQALSNAGSGGEALWNLITTGAFISIIPLIIAFLSLQKYWQGGLSLGSLK
ncbi:ABC transporter permease [Arthrobacter agilis]|uniref:ABC transporter permease n=1 Tax=Arthrobacter agilis TaxID=37921 RepID=A0A2L0UAX4_9MICC|nr:carbohydrate ABC transporter permease [Arthrobacter agilis]AUZ86401.1 ABC transporter permease [Arthrobacter agilis]